jgi:hypothetical protein
MKNNLYALIFGLAIIISAALIGNAFKNRNKTDGNISVTGLGKADFTSDLIVWEGSYSTLNSNLKQAYTNLENDKKIITAYLNEKGVNTDEIVFNAVSTTEKKEQKYSEAGRYMGDKFIGYLLSQSIKIESKNVAQIEKISREITELLNKGVQFYSQPPRYYYTKLADLKIEMISKATEDARIRAEKIATNSGSSLGDLTSAKMGIFQITGQNSNENYSWGGTFNTSSKKKTASITMKLDYIVK